MIEYFLYLITVACVYFLVRNSWVYQTRLVIPPKYHINVVSYEMMLFGRFWDWRKDPQVWLKK